MWVLGIASTNTIALKCMLDSSCLPNTWWNIPVGNPPEIHGDLDNNSLVLNFSSLL